MAGAFRNVSLGTPLRDEIDAFIKEHPEYKSAAEFVSEAARLRVQELTHLEFEKLKIRGEGHNEG